MKSKGNPSVLYFNRVISKASPLERIKNINSPLGKNRNCIGLVMGEKTGACQCITMYHNLLLLL
jgi:hypothetical protein